MAHSTVRSGSPFTGRREPRPHSPRLGTSFSERPQCGTQEYVGAGDNAAWVARQREHGGAGDTRERDWLPRLDRDPPEDELVHPREDVSHDVVLADGGASTGHYPVRPRRYTAKPPVDRLRVVADACRLYDDSTGVPRQGAQKGTVGVVNLARSERVPGGAKLAACRQDGDARPRMNADLRPTERGKNADVQRCECLARTDDFRSRPEVFTPRPDGLTRPRGLPQSDGLAI